MKILFKGGTVVTAERSYLSDILVEDEKIIKIAKDIITDDCEVIDVSGKLIFPGFIDAHTHLDLVTSTNTADDFYTGTKAAISGGTTTIIDFGTQNIGESLNEALDNWHKKADNKSSCDYGFHMSISDWSKKTENEIDDMVRKGVTSFKIYMAYDNLRVSDSVMYQILKKVKSVGGIVGTHCENGDMVNVLTLELLSKGKTSPQYHPLSRPEIVETEAINRYLSIAELADAPVVIVHLSTEGGFEIAENFRDKGNKVYLETCPQYLLMNDSAYKNGTIDDKKSDDDFAGAKFVMSPPLRKEKDQNALWSAFGKNKLDTISTDHCSFNYKGQKEMGRDNFSKIPNGGPCIEHRPSLIYSFGVNTGKITKEQMCRCLSTNPAKLYGMYPEKGEIAVGSFADLVVWNPDEKWTISAKTQLQNCDYTPYEGVEVVGKAERVYLRGKLISDNGVIVEENAGKYIFRKKSQTY